MIKTSKELLSNVPIRSVMPVIPDLFVLYVGARVIVTCMCVGVCGQEYVCVCGRACNSDLHVGVCVHVILT